MRPVADIDLGSLRAAMTGAVLGPEDPGFDEARRVWNGAFDPHPAAIARCADPPDVAQAIGFARRHGLEIAVRGGGHSLSGSSTVDDGLVIDLGAMNRVLVDPVGRRAVVGGGATLADRDVATQAHGLAAPSGLVSHTGVAGLTLAGGLGFLARKAGLAIDNVLSVEVVTADGQVRRASPDEDADLYWAVRGGGGNFGVVTEFEFRLHRVGPQVEFAFLFWPSEQGTEALRLCQSVIDTTSRDLIAMPLALNAPPEPFVPEPLRLTPGYGVVLVGFGAEQEHAAAVSRMRRVLPPLVDLVTPMPYLQLLQMFDDANRWGKIAYDSAVCVESLSDDVIAVLTEHMPRKRSPESMVFFYRLDGAYSEVDEQDTAYAGGRSPRFAVIIVGVAETVQQLPAEGGWVRSLRDALRPLGIGRDVYVNMSDELTGEGRVRSAYGDAKYERLARIKATYDPDNVFHRNANIRPAPAW